MRGQSSRTIVSGQLTSNENGTMNVRPPLVVCKPPTSCLSRSLDPAAWQSHLVCSLSSSRNCILSVTHHFWLLANRRSRLTLMDTTDAQPEEAGIERAPSPGVVYGCRPCSGFADFLYSNWAPKTPAASTTFVLHTTGSNAAKGAAAGCKGCTLIHDAVTTFRQGRLPMDDYSITCFDRSNVTESRCLKVLFHLKPVRYSILETPLHPHAHEDLMRQYMYSGILVRLDWADGK